MEMGGSGFDRIPEGCIAHVIGLTCPRDACRSAAVSSAFRSASESDTVWERFLPTDLRSVLDRAVDPAVVECSSNKELFFRLCDPILIDGGKMSFALEKSSGAKCYMLSARALHIAWGDTPAYWRWLSVETERYGALRLSARFSEVAQLQQVFWLEIRGKIDNRMLPPKVTYVAYLIYKLVEYGTGFRNLAEKASVKVGAHESTSTVCLQPVSSGRSRRGFQRLRRRGAIGNAAVPGLRDDGWMEIEMGHFFNDESEDGEVEMCLKEVEQGHWKSGLIIHGIEVRPKKN